MTRQEILSSNHSKTRKIEMLLELGMTRREVASALNVGYGFVQNTFARKYPERIRSRRNLEEVVAELEFILREFNFNHTFGVEIEAYGIRREELVNELREAAINVELESYNHNTRTHWKVTTDSSLTGENTFELVSPKLTGEAGLRELKTVVTMVRGLEAKVNKSCGLHIHFDASGFDTKTFKNIMLNYAKIETLIDSFMPDSRRESRNTYCKSIKRITNVEQKLLSVNELDGIENGIRSLERNATGSDRYYKVNLQAYWNHRSTEFHQHAGTVNYTKMQNWILFLARLIEYSKNAVLKDGDWNSLSKFLPEDMIEFFKARSQELN